MLHRNLVQQLSATEIADVYGAIPQTVTSIHHGYDFNAPPNFSRPIFNEVEDFYLKMLNSIPSHVRAVGFYNLDVPPGSKLALLGLLAAIPKHVNSLSLIDFNPQMQGNDLEEVFSKIPSHVKTLELAFSNYTNNVQENINAIQAIPSHVTTLKFAGKGIGHVKQLIEFIKQVPNKITTLDLSGYRLTDMSEEELSQLFSKIPESITTVNLTDSMGFRPFQPNHVRALSNIPPHVKNIILGPLILGYPRDKGRLSELVQNLPTSIRTLDLSKYKPLYIATEYLTVVMPVIPPHIHTLDISNHRVLDSNLPNRRSIIDLSAIPSHISTLRITKDQSIRDRYNPFFIPFEDFIKKLPAHVTTLDLSNNLLGDFGPYNLVSLIKAIPPTVKHIVLRDNYLFHGKSIQQRNELLNALLPFSSNGRLDISSNGEAEFARIAATSIINAAPQLPMDIWNQIIGTYLLPDTVENPTQKIKSAQCQSFLNELQFEQHLDKFKAKRDLIKNKPGYEKALTAFNELITQLEARKDNFIKQNNSSLKAKNQFKVDCLTDIAKAKEVLVQHRGWKKFFADLLSVFCSVLSAGLANRITGKSIFGLFPVKTDSQEKIESFEEKLNKNKPEA